MRTLGFLLLLALAAGSGSVANAGLDEARDAYERADYATALRELQPLAEQGNAYAQSRLGWMYLGGYGVARNPDEASKWLRKAVDQGDAHAQGGLGYMYVLGVGVRKDLAEGLRWIRLSADQGNPLAQNMLGLMYRRGEGVPRDEAEALKWIARAAGAFRKAAERGDASAQNMLASMHANGQGVPKDDSEAVKWLRKAAQQGHAAAQFSLGIAYGSARGVAMDEAEALKWYRMAADQGNADARIRLIALEKKLAAANRDRAPSAATSPPHPDPAPRAYTNAVHRWSVSYPSDWKLDAANPADVRVVSPAGDGLCGLHSAEVRFATVDEYADFMQAQSAKYFKDRGVAVRDAPKRQITLDNGASGIDVTTEIMSGGKSRRIYVLADAKGYAIDCETYATNWGKLEPLFSRIIGSFSPHGKP